MTELPHTGSRPAPGKRCMWKFPKHSNGFYKLDFELSMKISGVDYSCTNVVKHAEIYKNGRPIHTISICGIDNTTHNFTTYVEIINPESHGVHLEIDFNGLKTMFPQEDWITDNLDTATNNTEFKCKISYTPVNITARTATELGCYLQSK